MIIGIDARPLTTSKPTGISIYLHNVLSTIEDNVNEYILYVNGDIQMETNFSFKYKVVKYDCKISTLFIYYKLNKLLSRDCVDVFWGTEHILPKKNKTIKMILTVHDLALIINKSWGTWKNALVQNVYTKKSIKNADKILSVSNATKNDVIKLLQKKENDITVTYLSCNNTKYASDDSIIKKYELDKYAIFVGTLDKRKNVSTYIKAISYLNEKNNSNYKLVLAGRQGNDKKIPKLIKKYSLQNNVIITGYISNEQKESLINNSAFVIFASNYEGFGLPIIEAYNHEKLVIVANNSSLREVAGEMAPYIDKSNDFQSLALEMEKLFNSDDSYKQELLARCKEAAINVSWDDVTNKTIKVLLGE